MRTVVFRGEVIPVGDNLPRRVYAKYAYVCPACGELWGKLETTAPDCGTYIVAARSCENHSSRFDRGGSFLSQLVSELSPTRDVGKTLDCLSPRLLRHEAEMRIREILKKG